MRFSSWCIIISSAVLAQGWPIVGHITISQEELSIERASRAQDCQARRVLLRPRITRDQGYQVNILGQNTALPDEYRESYESKAYDNHDYPLLSSYNKLYPSCPSFGVALSMHSVFPQLSTLFRDPLFWCAVMVALVAFMAVMLCKWTLEARRATKADHTCDDLFTSKELESAAVPDEYNSVLVRLLDVIEAISS